MRAREERGREGDSGEMRAIERERERERESGRERERERARERERVASCLQGCRV